MSMGSNSGGAFNVPGSQPPQTIVVQNNFTPGTWGRLRNWFLYLMLTFSLLANFGMYSAYEQYFSDVDGATEQYHSGDREASAKIARINVSGTIMPPFTKHILEDIKKAKDDDKVKGVLLVVDSPGGLVSDSHEIYHRLTELRAKKPIVVSMKGMAASGGYYVSMGAGKEAKIFAEPVTWTGSIGVIIPHYDISKLASDFGVKVEPLKTGEFKDALSPFKPISDAEHKIWENVLNQSFETFLTIIDENRDTLDLDAARKIATGQIYTAKDAKQLGMIDEIGYEDDAVESLKKQLNLSEARVVHYHHAASLSEILTGSAEARDPRAMWKSLLETSVPRAMYYCSWSTGVPFAK